MDQYASDTSITRLTSLRTKSATLGSQRASNSGSPRTQYEQGPFATPASRSISRRPRASWYFSRKWVFWMSFYISVQLRLPLRAELEQHERGTQVKQSKNKMRISYWRRADLRKELLRERTYQRRTFIYLTVTASDRIWGRGSEYQLFWTVDTGRFKLS